MTGLKLMVAVLATLGALVGTAAVQAQQTWSPRLERQVLEALDEQQAEAFAAGADPAAITFADGGTLAELIARAAAEAAAPLGYTPLDPCVLVRTARSPAGLLTPSEPRSFLARGRLGSQGGTRGGCGVPAEARAIAVVVRAAPRGKGSLQLWPAGGPKPGLPVVEYAGPGNVTATALLELCQGDGCEADFQARALGASSHLTVSVVGYLAPLELAQGDPGPPGARGPAGPPGPPGGACSVTTSGDEATLTCPDGSTVSWPLSPAPATVRSFQVVTPEIEVEAGQEIKICYYFRTPNTETVGIKRWASQMPGVVHDLMLVATPGTDKEAPGTVSSSNCFLGTNAASQVIFAAYTPSAELALPGDDGTGKPLANELGPSTPAFLMLHFFNPTSEAMKVKVILDAQSLAPGVAYTRSGTLLHHNLEISIPPGATGDVESQTVEAPPGIKFWRLSTHAHKQAVHTEIKDGASVVFASDDWENPGASTFGPPGFHTFSSGDLTTACTYDNLFGDNSARTITSGESEATEERCLGLGFFFPAPVDDPVVICLNDTGCFNLSGAL